MTLRSRFCKNHRIYSKFWCKYPRIAQDHCSMHTLLCGKIRNIAGSKYCIFGGQETVKRKNTNFQRQGRSHSMMNRRTKICFARRWCNWIPKVHRKIRRIFGNPERFGFENQKSFRLATMTVRIFRFLDLNSLHQRIWCKYCPFWIEYIGSDKNPSKNLGIKLDFFCSLGTPLMSLHCMFGMNHHIGSIFSHLLLNIDFPSMNLCISCLRYRWIKGQGKYQRN